MKNEINKSLGQDTKVWGEFWKGLTPETEIPIWDYYWGRHWLSKFVPRHGKVIEAGCGLGRYVFYFSRLGIDIEGIDFEKATIDYLNDWKQNRNFNCSFFAGDVKKLNYDNDSLSGYISLGVIEHFIEGPQQPIREAFRVLKPGGVAILMVPAKSFSYYIDRILIKNLKIFAKIIIGKKNNKRPFFQYWYNVKQLKNFVENEKFTVSRFDNCGLLFSFIELANFRDKTINENSFAVWFSNKFENTFFAKMGSQSIVIAIKKADIMYCFLCGDYSATEKSLENYDVPICEECAKENHSVYYKKNQPIKLNLPILISPLYNGNQNEICEYCGKEYITDPIFEDYGFKKKCCGTCLKREEINIELTSKFIQPIWRSRK